MDVERVQVETELGRILSSNALEGADRAKAILAYVVGRELDGNGARIKAYSIGTDVLGRPESFDPNDDSIVRVEVGRLRKTLQLYYATEGAGNPVRIVIERGTYRPDFRAATAMPAHAGVLHGPASGVLLAALAVIGILAFLAQDWLQIRHSGEHDWFEPAQHLQGPRILALPFENVTQNGENDTLAAGLTIDTISELARFRWLVVYAADQNASAWSRQTRLTDYRLSGQVQRGGNEVVVSARLEDFETGAILWSETFQAELNVENLVSIQRDIARAIAIAVGQPNGIVGRIEQSLSQRDTARTLEAYRCVMLTYVYWRTFNPAEHASSRDCFEAVLDKEPDYAEGLAAYAFLTLDEYRYNYNPRQGYDPLERALDYAERAVMADPYSSLAAQARFTLAALQGDMETFQKIGLGAIRRNPNNPELLADYGGKLALTFGDWATGIAHIQRAWSLNPVPPSWSLLAPATQAYLDGRCKDALAFAERVNAPNLPNVLLTRIACYHLLGDTARRDSVLMDARAAGLVKNSDAVRMVHRLSLYPELKKRFIDDVTAALEASGGHTS